MKTGPDGIAVMHYFEACRLKAYPDPATGGKPWTIGYGDTGPDVVPGLVITQAEADGRFAKRLAREFEPGVLNSVQQNPSQRQFDAMVCLAYNIGLGNFRSSTLLRKFNLGDTAAASAQFLVWNKAAGKVMLGLRRRRAAERALFDGMSGEVAIRVGAEVN
jgi:lysozyme